MDKSLEEHFTENIFTGHKDTDRLILLNLNGKDLLSFCSSTPYFNSLCNEELFRNRIRNTALEEIKDKYPEMNYRNFYAVMMYYIALMQEKYNYTYDLDYLNEGDPKVQYRLLQDYPIDEDRLLMEASRKGELGILKHAENKDIALIWAVEYGHLEIVKWSIQKGADIHKYDDRALRYAAFNGYLGIVKYLVEHGANIHANDERPLRYAAVRGHLEEIKYFIERGANIHVLDDYAVVMAVGGSHLGAVSYTHLT